MLSIRFECGLKYNGPVDRKTLNELAKRYFTSFIYRYKEMEWCDVIIYDEHRHDIGASRNPPSLPHKAHICETCVFSDKPPLVDNDGLICCNPNKEWRWFAVLPEDSCEDWRSNDDYYFKED